MTGARAPGDGDKLCTVTLPALGREPPPLPANARVLMDSYDYITLLPSTSEESAVWQQVDLDDNNVPGRRTEVRFKSSVWSSLEPSPFPRKGQVHTVHLCAEFSHFSEKSQ